MASRHSPTCTLLPTSYFLLPTSYFLLSSFHFVIPNIRPTTS